MGEEKLPKSGLQCPQSCYYQEKHRNWLNKMCPKTHMGQGFPSAFHLWFLSELLNKGRLLIQAVIFLSVYKMLNAASLASQTLFLLCL